MNSNNNYSINSNNSNSINSNNSCSIHINNSYYINSNRLVFTQLLLCATSAVALSPMADSIILLFTTINRIAIITTINRIAIITTINIIAIITTINRIAIIGHHCVTLCHAWLHCATLRPVFKSPIWKNGPGPWEI